MREAHETLVGLLGTYAKYQWGSPTSHFNEGITNENDFQSSDHAIATG